MSRQLKRVALDFAWPIDKVWEGYVNPWYAYQHECKACDGTGYGPIAKLFYDQWYGYAPFDPASMGSKPFPMDQPEVVALAKRNVPRVSWGLTEEIARLLGHFNAQWSHHLCQTDVDALWAEKRLWEFKEKPTVEQVNAWSLVGFGHDSINCSICVTARCEREGVEVYCPICEGHGNIWSNPDAKAKADAWGKTEPPTGKGWQMWQTISEGSPISPVFATPQELARWLASDGDSEATYDQWLAMITGPGWAPSMIGGPNGLQTGVAAIGDELITGETS